MQKEEFLLGMMGIMLTGGVVWAASWLLYEWIKRRRPDGALAPGVDVARLQQQVTQLQQSLDSVAVEVERISEGQRFVTKLLADRAESVKLPPVQH